MCSPQAGLPGGGSNGLSGREGWLSCRQESLSGLEELLCFLTNRDLPSRKDGQAVVTGSGLSKQNLIAPIFGKRAT